VYTPHYISKISNRAKGAILLNSTSKGTIETSKRSRSTRSRSARSARNRSLGTSDYRACY
jgi:hypothetical protein